MEVASHKTDSLRIRGVPAMEEEESVDADDGRRARDCFGPERLLNVPPSKAAAAPDGGHRRPPNPAFLVGFKDCHQEVLRYLVNIERVPLEGPVIFGLEKHLTNLESRMSCDCADRNIMPCETMTQSNCATQIRVNKTDNDDDDEEEDDDNEFSSFKNCLTTAQDGRFLDEEKEEKEPVCDTSSTRERNDHRIATADDDVAALRAENSSFDSGCCDSSGLLLVVASSSEDGSLSMDCSTYDEVSTTSPSSDAAAAADRPKQGGDAETTITESELAENALELMHLAHNNPCISRILNELFVLMENDYDDDDVDDDDDNDDDDGVEMEENDGVNSEFHDDC